MPIFSKPRKHVLYLHVPKTGGTAVEDCFRALGFRVTYFDDSTKSSLWRVHRCSPQHLHAAALSSFLRIEAFDYVFMTVRHPYTRTLSEYAMHLRTGQASEPFRPWLDRMLREFTENPFARDNHIRPQHEFWLPNCDVFRQEDGFGAPFLTRVRERLGLESDIPPLLRANEAPIGPSLEKLLDDDSRALLRTFYWRDFNQFGYQG